MEATNYNPGKGDRVPGDPPPGCPALSPFYGHEGDTCASGGGKVNSCACRIPLECDQAKRVCVAGPKRG